MRELTLTEKHYRAEEEKEFKQARYAFVKGLNEAERAEKNKPEKIRKLERRFIKDSDRIFLDEVLEVRKGKLKKMNYIDLIKLDNKMDRRATRLYELAQEYSKLVGDETYVHPNYDKYLDYSRVVFDALELEIAFRGGADLKT